MQPCSFSFRRLWGEQDMATDLLRSNTPLRFCWVSCNMSVFAICCGVNLWCHWMSLMSQSKCISFCGVCGPMSTCWLRVVPKEDVAICRLVFGCEKRVQPRLLPKAPKMFAASRSRHDAVLIHRCHRSADPLIHFQSDIAWHSVSGIRPRGLHDLNMAYFLKICCWHCLTNLFDIVCSLSMLGLTDQLTETWFHTSFTRYFMKLQILQIAPMLPSCYARGSMNPAFDLPWSAMVLLRVLS